MIDFFISIIKIMLKKLKELKNRISNEFNYYKFLLVTNNETFEAIKECKVNKYENKEIGDLIKNGHKSYNHFFLLENIKRLLEADDMNIFGLIISYGECGDKEIKKIIKSDVTISKIVGGKNKEMDYTTDAHKSGIIDSIITAYSNEANMLKLDEGEFIISETSDTNEIITPKIIGTSDTNETATVLFVVTKLQIAKMCVYISKNNIDLNFHASKELDLNCEWYKFMTNYNTALLFNKYCK